MHFSEQLSAPVSLEVAWEFVWQADRLALCLPGCTGVDVIEPRERYRANLQDRIGPYTLRFPLDVVVQEVDPRKRIRLLATGNDEVLGVSQRIDLVLSLHSLGPARTALDVEAEVEVQGAIARLGGFLVKRKAGEIVKQLARNVEAALGRQVDAER